MFSAYHIGVPYDITGITAILQLEEELDRDSFKKRNMDDQLSLKGNPSDFEQEIDLTQDAEISKIFATTWPSGEIRPSQGEK